MITIHLSDDEATGLNRLIDLAVRQGGLAVAPLASMLNQKLVEAIRTDQTPKPNGKPAKDKPSAPAKT